MKLTTLIRCDYNPKCLNVNSSLTYIYAPRYWAEVICDDWKPINILKMYHRWSSYCVHCFCDFS